MPKQARAREESRAAVPKSGRALTGVEHLLRLVQGRHCRVGHGHRLLTLASFYWVILLPVIVGIEKLLEPLDELKVILEFPLHQFVNRDNLVRAREVWRVITARVPPFVM